MGEYWIAAIADGIGGSSGGEIASKLAIEEVQSKLVMPGQMRNAFESARASIRSRSLSKPDLAKMGTTLSCILMADGTAEVGHVGDTRITHFRGGGVMARTQDQTEVQRLLDNGIITIGQAKRHPRRNVIYSALSGRTDKYTLFDGEFDIQVGDRIVLSSDGFHSHFLRRELAGISESSSTLESFVKSVEMKLKNEELVDDATAIFMEVTA